MRTLSGFTYRFIIVPLLRIICSVNANDFNFFFILSSTALSVSTGISFVSTDTNKNYVTLADGVAGQIKHIIHIDI